MLSNGFNIDTAPAIEVAERAVRNLKPAGYPQVRDYLALIFEKWKLEFGVPPSKSGYGLLGMVAESENLVVLSDFERLHAVSPLFPWDCAGQFCHNEIDLFVIIWTQYGEYLSGYTREEGNLFFWFLGLLILEKNNDESAASSVINAGQILQRIEVNANRETLVASYELIDALGKQVDGIAQNRKKGGEATASIQKERGEATKADIHRRASILLQTKSKKDIAGIIKNVTGYSKSTIRTNLRTHPSGNWKRV